MTGMNWLKAVEPGAGPIYRGIVAALEAAISGGELQPGERLPAQRAVAERLGVDLTTVTRAYAEATARGLVEGAVGRGTFVRAPREDEDAGAVDLSMNLPPPPAGISLGEQLRETTAAVLRRSDPALLMSYHPGFGTPAQRLAGADWLRPMLGEVAADRILVAPGAQAALAAVLQLLSRSTRTVIADRLTYPGFLNLAAQLDLWVLGCEADDQGLRPDALARLLEQAPGAAVYLVPTLHNPTAVTTSPERRAEIAERVRAAGGWIVEDDPYSRLLDAPPAALASLAPERSFYIGTLAKCISPGLRIAYLACPEAQTADAAAMLRATALMPSPLTAAIATNWIREGIADRLLAGVRTEARRRRQIAADLLPAAYGPPESIHVWLGLSAPGAAARLRAAAQQKGLSLVTADAFATGPLDEDGVRISLGGPARREALAGALKTVAELVRGAGPSRGHIV